MILVAVSPMIFLSPPPPHTTPEISVPTGGTTSPETNSAPNYLIYAPFLLPVGFTASNPHHSGAAAATMGRYVCTIWQPRPPAGEKALLRRIDKHGRKLALEIRNTSKQQRPESPTITLTWHACKHKVLRTSMANPQTRELISAPNT